MTDARIEIPVALPELPDTMPWPEQFSVAYLDGYFADTGEVSRHWARVRQHLVLLEGAHGRVATS